MLSSEEKTTVPALISYVNSDLFTLSNISSKVTLEIPDRVDIIGQTAQWETIIDYLPFKFFQVIESYPNMYTIENFDKKYIRNPKLCSYERYDTTNMWRPLMIINKCPDITKFDFDFIRYYNIQTFSNVLSVLIARVQNE